MKYEVVIEDMATEDLSDLFLYKTAFTHSVSRAKEQLSNLVMTAAKTYRSSPIGIVLIERFAHTKADFNRIHFGN